MMGDAMVGGQGLRCVGGIRYPGQFRLRMLRDQLKMFAAYRSGASEGETQPCHAYASLGKAWALNNATCSVNCAVAISAPV